MQDKKINNRIKFPQTQQRIKKPGNINLLNDKLRKEKKNISFSKNNKKVEPVNNKKEIHKNTSNDISISPVNNKMNNSNISISNDSVEIIKNSPFKDNKNDIFNKSIDKNSVSANNKKIKELDDNKGVFHNSANDNNKIVVQKNNSLKNEEKINILIVKDNNPYNKKQDMLAINTFFFDSSVKDPIYKSSFESNKLSVDNISSININSKEEEYKYKFRNIEDVISFSEQKKIIFLERFKTMKTQK